MLMSGLIHFPIFARLPAHAILHHYKLCCVEGSKHRLYTLLRAEGMTSNRNTTSQSLYRRRPDYILSVNYFAWRQLWLSLTLIVSAASSQQGMRYWTVWPGRFKRSILWSSAAEELLKRSLCEEPHISRSHSKLDPQRKCLPHVGESSSCLVLDKELMFSQRWRMSQKYLEPK